MGSTVPSSYFVELYKEKPDPWNFAGSDYERDKYRRTIEALPRERYRNACELACSIGVFTAMLAGKCDKLLAVDVSLDALNLARERCRAYPQAEFQQMDLLTAYPAGAFDLTTVCEFGFYFAPDDLQKLVGNVVSHSISRANVILVHWTPPVRGHAVETKDVHDAFRSDVHLRHLNGFDAETYRLASARRTAARQSACALTGAAASLPHRR